MDGRTFTLAPGPEKSNLTFLGTVSADGKFVTPMVIYLYMRVPKDIYNSVPKDFFIATSESGWMRAETFYEFIANAFNPYLVEKAIKSQSSSLWTVTNPICLVKSPISVKKMG